MKTIAISRRSRMVRRLLELAEVEEDIVLRTADGNMYLLSMVDDFAYEIARQRRNKKLMAFLKKRFEQAREEKGIPLEEVERRLGLNEGPSHDAEKSRRKTGPHPRRSARR
jgi:hypothetical protein